MIPAMKKDLKIQIMTIRMKQKNKILILTQKEVKKKKEDQLSFKSLIDLS